MRKTSKGTQEMYTNGKVRRLASLLTLIAALITVEALTQSTNSSLIDPHVTAKRAETEISVFFGTNKALTTEELRTNALSVLSKKGYAMPETSKCAINVQVVGKEAGCVVMFWDHNAKMRYVVTFDAHGKVSKVRSSAIRHGTPAPGEPLPKLPEGGVSVRP